MKILMILAPEDFRDEEYTEPRKIFEAHKFDVMTSSIQGIATGKFGLEVKIDIQLKDVKVEDFDAIFWVGGGGCLDFIANLDARKVAGEFFHQNKIIAAICAAPRLLLNWRLLEGKKITGWNGDNNLEDLALKGGAIYTGANIEVDGNVLTADGPDSAKKAGKALLEMLKK